MVPAPSTSSSSSTSSLSTAAAAAEAYSTKVLRYGNVEFVRLCDTGLEARLHLLQTVSYHVRLRQLPPGDLLAVLLRCGAKVGLAQLVAHAVVRLYQRETQIRGDEAVLGVFLHIASLLDGEDVRGDCEGEQENGQTVRVVR